VKRVLFVAYHFPPIGGGGVQRAVKFCRYLVEFGYQPVVVTGPGGSEDLWAPEDVTLGAGLPPEVEVHRVSGPEPLPTTGWRARADRALDLMPAARRWWVEGALRVGRRVGRDAEVVLGELVPYVTARAASRLAHDLGLPWVADLQDPWALDEMWLYPSALHRARDTARMRRQLGSANAIVMNTPEAALRVRHRFPELASRVAEAIPNGFDPADFEGVAAADGPPGVFRIVHSGYLHTDAGMRHRRTGRLRRLLGGAPVPGVDFLTRSHVFLLEAIGRLIAAEPRLASEIEVHLAGVLTAGDRAVAAASPVVRMHGYLPHAETIALLKSADLLFLPMHDLPAGVRAGLVPGKTYEYLGSGRPILAAVPDGDARELLTEAGNASVCRPADVGRMAEIIAGRISEWRNGHEPPAPRPDVLTRYERRRQTQQLARVLDDAIRPPGATLCRPAASVGALG
jgi:glycosyltransferase involved in cell wall biosynthesis